MGEYNQKLYSRDTLACVGGLVVVACRWSCGMSLEKSISFECLPAHIGLLSALRIYAWVWEAEGLLVPLPR